MVLREKKVKFSSEDGLKLHGTLTVPKDEVTGMMLMVHGITSDRTEWGIFDRTAAAVGRSGIASLRFDWRGHGESALDSTLITLDGILSDVLAAWHELETRLEGHGGRLRRYSLGSSYGGGVSCAAASRLGGVDRAFLVAPVLDYMVDLDHCAPKWKADLKHRDYIRYNELKLGRPLANEAMRFESLRDPNVPITIFHGTLDTDVSIDLSRAAVAEHKRMELVPIEGAGHVLNLPDDLELEDDRSWALVDEMIAGVTRRVG